MRLIVFLHLCSLDSLLVDYVLTMHSTHYSTILLSRFFSRRWEKPFYLFFSFLFFRISLSSERDIEYSPEVVTLWWPSEREAKGDFTPPNPMDHSRLNGLLNQLNQHLQRESSAIIVHRLWQSTTTNHYSHISFTLHKHMHKWMKKKAKKNQKRLSLEKIGEVITVKSSVEQFDRKLCSSATCVPHLLTTTTTTARKRRRSNVAQRVWEREKEREKWFSWCWTLPGCGGQMRWSGPRDMARFHVDDLSKQRRFHFPTQHNTLGLHFGSSIDVLWLRFF